MPTLNSIIPRIRAELAKSPKCDPLPNFYSEARAAKRRIAEAKASNNERAVGSACAAYGGVIKRWHYWLIDQITDVVLSGHDTSRWNVRLWQKRVFGRSVDSAK
ncbi:hypothetical protein ABLB69_02470 [Xenorhabdus khoisanae]|uniref:hypothetical protein n=1 Tax=Xenorhabdus khoisanae TaxID=880157 RepID=UPI002359FBB9|nr:hypothetical protein [Xenorhabdus khoisanae]MDC9616320.1 hypothetical protein [Xenorhabdus khoisanae]